MRPKVREKSRKAGLVSPFKRKYTFALGWMLCEQN